MPGTLAGMMGVALVYFVMSALIKWQGRRLLERLFPPVVIGPVIICICRASPWRGRTQMPIK